jgi:hypothetical protein
MQELEDAYTELANDREYQAEIELWDVTVGDGIDAEERDLSFNPIFAPDSGN